MTSQPSILCDDIDYHGRMLLLSETLGGTRLAWVVEIGNIAFAPFCLVETLPLQQTLVLRTGCGHGE